jgi:hypothetical protein
MRVKTLVQKNQMGKKKITKSSTNWVLSEFSQTDLTKAQTDGLITDRDQVIFPSTERIPKPLSGYRVMFFAFLLLGLSFPAHEFLCGLLFVYGVQLHHLTPNLILHIAYFVTLCESFLGIEPYWLLWKFLFRLLLLIQKILVSTERGSVLKSSFLRVPPPPKLLLGSLLLPMRMMNFTTF